MLDIINAVGGLVNMSFTIVAGLALLAFFWGLARFIFHVGGDEKAVEEGKRIMKKGAKLLVVDWKPEASLGPKGKVSMEEIIKIASEFDFKLETKFSASPYHYGLVLVK